MKIKTLRSPEVVGKRCVATIRATLCDKSKDAPKVADDIVKPLTRRLNSLARRLEGVKMYAGQTRGVGEYDESENTDDTNSDSNAKDTNSDSNAKDAKDSGESKSEGGKNDSLPLIAAAGGGGICCLGMIALGVVMTMKKGKARRQGGSQDDTNEDS